MKQPETFTSLVRPLMVRYLALKRALGRRAVAMAYIPRYLDRFLVSCDAADLMRQTFNAWAESMAFLHPTTRRARLRIVYNLCLFRRREDPLCFVPGFGERRRGLWRRKKSPGERLRAILWLADLGRAEKEEAPHRGAGRSPTADAVHCLPRCAELGSAANSE